jgi:hypothetical protein
MLDYLAQITSLKAAIFIRQIAWATRQNKA